MPQLDADGYPLPTPHDGIEEIFTDVFLVRGSIQLNRLMRFNRNMLILRHAGELTILNSLRLSAAVEAELDKLGRVRHVVRMGNFHGIDDAYFVNRYQAEFWAPIASRAKPGPTISQLLTETCEFPVPGVKILLFRQTRRPEAVLLLERAALLITCDCLQNYADRRYWSLLAKIMIPRMGFPLELIIGPIWLKRMTPANSSLKPDFERIRALPFKHLIAAHGSLLRDTAHEQVSAVIDKTFARQS
jgi:hypothetical protein